MLSSSFFWNFFNMQFPLFNMSLSFFSFCINSKIVWLVKTWMSVNYGSAKSSTSNMGMFKETLTFWISVRTSIKSLESAGSWSWSTPRLSLLHGRISTVLASLSARMNFQIILIDSSKISITISIVIAFAPSSFPLLSFFLSPASL